MLEPPSHTLPAFDGRARKAGAPAPRPQLYLALECERPLASPARLSLDGVDAVVIGRGAQRSVTRNVDRGATVIEVRVPDPWMSSTHARLSKVLGRWILEDAQSKNGTILNGLPHARGELGDRDVLELGHTFFLYRDAVPSTPEEPAIADGAQLASPVPGLATLIASLGRDLTALAQVARSPVSIVVHGESGTGKEVVARAVHAISLRTGPFIAVNCGALPDTLVESELFGHRKGAFSGAVEDRPGLIRSADHGTLFLDEIGDLPPPSQAAFLRVLQEREVVPIGAARPVSVDIRLIAATHRDLEALVERGEFRGDLFARISGFTTRLPPLRERREDLGLLIAALLRRHLPDRADKVRFYPEAARALFRYDWPRNIRELEKSLEMAVVLAAGEPIDVDHLPEPLRAALSAAPEPNAADAPPAGPLGAEDTRRKEELVALLAEHGGNISAVARAMGKARMQVQRWIKRFQLDPESYRR